MVFVAISVCIDNFATSLAYGLQAKERKFVVLLQVVCIFSIVQAGLAAIGWAIGISLSQWIEPFDHWIAFGLLLFMGLKLIKEAREEDHDTEKTTKSKNNLSIYSMLIVAIVTSTDSLAVGLTYAMLDVNILVAIILIACVTAIISILGFTLGNRIGEKSENRMDYFAGIVLIILGIKILIEHLISE